MPTGRRMTARGAAQLQKAKDAKSTREKITMMACAHLRLVSNQTHPESLTFAKGAPMPPLFRAALGAKA